MLGPLLAFGVFIHGVGHREPQASSVMIRGSSTKPNPHEALIHDLTIHHAVGSSPRTLIFLKPGVFLMLFRFECVHMNLAS